MNQPMNQPMNGQPMMHQPKASKTPWLVLAVVVIVVLAVLGFLFRDKLGATKSNAKLSGYQAVFLTNGQVYFGNMTDKNDRYVTLKDIYYLQVNQSQQLQDGQQAAAQQQPELSLVKLGNELHGPDDIMHINRDQILFFEELKNDGRVAEAIKSYKANPNATTPAATGTTPSTTTPATGTGTTAPAGTTPTK
jgi:hypothetical protein